MQVTRTVAPTPAHIHFNEPATPTRRRSSAKGERPHLASAAQSNAVAKAAKAALLATSPKATTTTINRPRSASHTLALSEQPICECPAEEAVAIAIAAAVTEHTHSQEEAESVASTVARACDACGLALRTALVFLWSDPKEGDAKTRSGEYTPEELEDEGMEMAMDMC